MVGTGWEETQQLVKEREGEREMKGGKEDGGREEDRELQYLLEDPAGVHAPGEGLDGDHSLSHPQVGLSISHHAVLLLTDHCSTGETQLLRMPERRRERENFTYY